MPSLHQAIKHLEDQVNQRILGQRRLVNRMLVALLADGHLLVEGVPGLAKTSAVRVMAAGIEGDFHRIQFTPDLLPADLTGTEVFQPQDGGFVFRRGPLFHNFLLADEINRAPAKVQSALLEAMAERQVTIGRHTYLLDELFMVMATQNPIEQEGTYPLPEAQRDRFLLQVRVDYPDTAAEQEIVRLVRGQRLANKTLDADTGPKIGRDTLLQARREVLELHLAPALENYLVRLVGATRQPAPFDREAAEWVAFGASPRASIALDLAARAHAWLAARDYVSPADIQALAPDVLRHRIILGYEAEADGVTTDQVIERLIARVAVP
ncbi:MAG: MoxR family ATPase [Pseudomonadota bacterium]|nr:MoxR family ATPase [Pseudomonadota bacterium]